MRAAWLPVGFVAFMSSPQAARAEDLSEALKFAKEFIGDDAVRGLEDYIEAAPDEALAILLAEHAPTAERARARANPPFRTLGTTRLSYEKLASVIREASELSGLPAALIDAVIRTESGYRPDAVSNAGAQGLMQIMPETAKELGLRRPFDPRENVIAGARYLRRLLDRFGSMRLALSAYNAGPSAVQSVRDVPAIPETRRYVRTVLTRYEQSRLGGIHEE